jgi:alkylation response protein AidB-like acyl-CoA dehydrogenase
MLIARTDADAPKHQGISYFAIDMHQGGVDIRPLREITGRALFNEVFLTDARTADDALIGGLNNGWAVANTTLAKPACEATKSKECSVWKWSDTTPQPTIHREYHR